MLEPGGLGRQALGMTFGGQPWFGYAMKDEPWSVEKYRLRIVVYRGRRFKCYHLVRTSFRFLPIHEEGSKVEVDGKRLRLKKKAEARG